METQSIFAAADTVKYFAHMRDTSNPHISNKQPSIATINRLKRTLKAAFNTAVAQLGYLRTNPFAGIRTDKATDNRIRYVRTEEFQSLLDACDQFRKDPGWWRAVLLISYVGGLRVGEVLNLTWADVDFEQDSIHITAKPDREQLLPWTPKDHETRAVPVPVKLIDILANRQASAKHGNSYIFITAERVVALRAAMSAGRWHDGMPVLSNFHEQFGLS